jgi:uncharacterized membrane protein
LSKKKNKKKRHKKHQKVGLPNRPPQPIPVDDPNTRAVQQDNPLKTGRIVAQHSTFSGPIPPPELLAKYAEIIPNGADRILIMAENQSTHRQHIEKWAVIGGTILSYVGVVCACVIALFVSYYGYQLISSNHVISGTIFAGFGLTGLVGAFIYGTRSRREERVRRDQQNRELTRQR